MLSHHNRSQLSLLNGSQQCRASRVWYLLLMVSIDNTHAHNGTSGPAAQEQNNRYNAQELAFYILAGAGRQTIPPTSNLPSRIIFLAMFPRMLASA
ncbi:hypothetical protein K474DRAFT_657423 [Panus rudis PR-1116 ss-1]|nr:hypothetical protein K474DRAFT_657423 [Panus rudis PR-1116 ss-1]